MNVFTVMFRRDVTTLFLTVLAASVSLSALSAPLSARLTGHLPHEAIARAHVLGRSAGNEPVTLALTLPLRDQAGLDDLLQRLYDPKDPAYGQFLTPDEFAERFSPTPEDYAAVASFARQQGLTVTATHPNRLVLDVAGPAARVETAFGVHLLQYQSEEGRLFRAPDTDPSIPASLSGRLAEVVGLDTAALRRPHLRPALNPAVGSGPKGGLTPSDIQKAYSFQNVTATGAGQSVALFELDGFAPSDITSYQSAYHLPTLSPQTILVDGASGAAGSSADEVTLDIEMTLAAAPGLSHLYVYEAPSDASDAAVLDCYSKIATDNLAKQVSTSWGAPENQLTLATMQAENQIFQQMAAQGQSVLSASGDNGAYDDGSTLSVDDPSSQPYVTGVGGTSLTTDSSGDYVSETTWGDSTDTSTSPFGSGSGGGFSTVWPTPSYQTGLSPMPSERSVPDVALDADPNTGYSIYFARGWRVYGGTSTAVPIWAGLFARVNQVRAAQGLGPQGFANPLIYQIGASASYRTDFHDITSGTNLFYPAKTGYDNATGWGSFIGSALLNTLVNGLPTNQTGTVTGQVTAADTGSPISGAAVAAVSTTGSVQEASAVTDANGDYSLSVPSQLSLVITVSAYPATGGGYAGAKTTITSVATGQTLPLNFALNPAHTFPPGMQMISSPYRYDTVGDFATLFGLTLPLQSSSPQLVQWDPTLSSYVFYPAAPVSTLTPGQGYWASFPAASYIHFDGVPVPTGQPYSINLEDGWNQIGDPFTAAAPLSAMTVGGLPLTASPLVSATLYGYTSGAYVALNPATDSLQPYAGYWIYARQPATLLVSP